MDESCATSFAVHDQVPEQFKYRPGQRLDTWREAHDQFRMRCRVTSHFDGGAAIGESAADITEPSDIFYDPSAVGSIHDEDESFA